MSDEEKEDFHIKPTDSLIIAAKIVKKLFNSDQIKKQVFYGHY